MTTNSSDCGQAGKISASNPTVNASTIQEATTATEAELALGLAKCLKLYTKACLWSIFFSTCVVMEGFDMMLLNSLYAYPPFQRQFGARLADGSYGLSAAWQSGLSLAAFGGQIVGLFLNGIIADRFGYRKTLIGALIGCFVFIFIIFFSETRVQLLIGELLIGIPWGIFQTITVSYASEVCPTHLRAYLTTYVNLCWIMGQFIASGVLRAMLTRNDQWGYKIPFALQWMWPIPLMIGIWLAPESPWWLVRRGRLGEAKRSLDRLTSRNSGAPFQPDETISMMIYTNEVEREIEAGTSYLELFKSVNLRRTEIVCIAWMVQPFSGNTFSSYSTYFYEQAGLASESSFSMTLGQYGLGAVGTIISWFLMRHFGRRTLYLSGQVISCVVLFAIGCTSFAGRDNTAAQWASGSMMIIYTFIYNCTIGPVCYSLISELPSTRLRIKSTVLARNVYNISCIVTNLITPRMINPTAWNWGTRSGFFWAGTCFLCAMWTFFRLPEPKGRTYAELDILFANRISARKFKTTPVEKLNSHGNVADKKEGIIEGVPVEHVDSQTVVKGDLLSNTKVDGG